jgi:plasmid stabilization system protein ParE
MPETAVRFHRLALREYLEAFDKYASISLELAQSYKNEIDKAVGKIADNPERWPVFGRSFRWVRTKRFPYILYYQIHEENVEVLAVAHSRRRPGYWKRRKNY